MSMGNANFFAKLSNKILKFLLLALYNKPNNTTLSEKMTFRAFSPIIKGVSSI